jgi:hypothetical protein
MAFYVNTANPGPQSPYWKRPGPEVCDGTLSLGCSYNYGWNAASQAFGTVVSVRSATVAASRYWWLDVETANSWQANTAFNAETLKGYVDYLKSRGVSGIGVYSTSYQWTAITGGLQLSGLATWVAGVRSESSARSACSTASFNGGQVILAQYASKGFSADLVCGGGKAR